MARSPHRPRQDGAQRWASILVGAFILALVGYLTLDAKDALVPAAELPSAPDAAPTTLPTEATTPDAGAFEPELVIDGGLSLPKLTLDDTGALPAGAPRSVKIGVVLVSFAGADGAPPSARSKGDAYSIAERLANDARSDFHGAVMSGDPGSADDIGRMPRGVLDPRTERAVFGLAPGEVSDVLETPRGYWIVKRID